ncbi:MAG: class I SAM-dependent methyltransferase [Myxococcota bacterium]
MLWQKAPRAAEFSELRGGEKGGIVHPSKALRIFISDIRDRTTPQILDTGQVIGANIEYFAGMGCKVFVHDVVAELCSDLDKPEPPARLVPGTRWGGLPYEDEQFDGVLMWDLLDFFHGEEVPAVIAELFRVLKKEGYLFGLFCSERSDRIEEAQRYRIVDTGMLEHVSAGKTHGEKLFVTRLRNRAILDAFVPHRVLHFIMLKNRMREIVVRK